MKIPPASLLLAVLGTPVLGAESAATSIDRLVACADQQDVIVRLACFDREVAPLASARRAASTMTPAPAIPAATVPPAPAVPATAPSTTAPAATTSSFGQDQLKPKDQPAESAADATLHARIASFRSAGQGTYTITLDNGQVWRHEDGNYASYLVVGEAVTISKGAMRSYRLTRDAGPAKHWLRVSRIR